MIKQDVWMNRHARPIDLARWKYLWYEGTREDVFAALTYYQNEDGGFGHGLEADNWNPNSSPIQAWTATRILREMDFFERGHPTVEGLVRYLKTSLHEGKWPALVESNNDFPRAAWWNYEPIGVFWGYNPSAALLGYLARVGEVLEEEIKSAVTYLLAQTEYDMHEFPLFVTLYQDLEALGWDSDVLFDLRRKIETGLEQLIVTDPTQWTSYVFMPSTVFNRSNREFQAPYKDLIEIEKQYLHATVNEDGSWEIPWEWGQYEQEFAVAKEWWKGQRVIQYMEFLAL